MLHSGDEGGLLYELGQLGVIFLFERIVILTATLGSTGNGKFSEYINNNSHNNTM